MIATREGLHEGAAQWALVNKVPRAAKRSRLGVWTPFLPPMQLTQSFRSSTAMKSTLERCSLAFRQKTTKASRAEKKGFFMDWQGWVMGAWLTKKAGMRFRKEKKVVV